MTTRRRQARKKQVHFEDVQEGMELPSRSWGPISSAEGVRFCSAVDSYGGLHTDYKWCREHGFENVLINGPLKQALLISWLDDWVGEGGFVKKLGCQHRAMDYHDDTLIGLGKVTKKYEKDELGYVECEIRLENQKRGEITCPGSATVILPKRGQPPVPIVYDASPAPIRDDERSTARAAGTSTGTGGTLVTSEVKKMIGAAGEPFAWPEPLDRSTVRRFAEATFEEKPIYTNEAHAKNSRYGELTAPPAYVLRPPFGFWDMGSAGEAAVPPVELPGAPRTVNGGNEAEWFRPVQLGDTVTQEAYIADIYERVGRLGPMAFIIAETVFTNQRGAVVAKSRQVTIRLP